MSARRSRPSHLGCDACMKFSPEEHLGDVAGKRNVRPYHPLFCAYGFLVSCYSLDRVWGSFEWDLWIGRAGHLGPGSAVPVTVEVFNVGGWLAHGDYACSVDVDFLGVVDQRLITAKVRHEWSRLRKDGVHSVWSPASQKHSHVGQAGCGVRLPSSGPLMRRVGRLGQFCLWVVGRACILLLANHDLEARAKTGLLFDAVMGELAAVAGCQTRLIVGDFDVEPNLILCLLKVIGSGPWVDFEDAWSAAAGKTLGVTCKMFLGSAAGSKRDFVVAGPLAAASLSSCDVVLERWIQPLFAVRVVFFC